MLHRLKGSEGDQTSDARSLVSWWIKNHVRSASIIYHSYVSDVKWAYMVETHSFNLVWNTSIGVILLAHISISAKKMDQNTDIQQRCQTFLQQNSTTNITMEVFLHPFFLGTASSESLQDAGGPWASTWCHLVVRAIYGYSECRWWTTGGLGGPRNKRCCR